MQVTRSIGDFDAKWATRGGVTAEPEVTQTALQVRRARALAGGARTRAGQGGGHRIPLLTGPAVGIALTPLEPSGLGALCRVGGVSSACPQRPTYTRTQEGDEFLVLGSDGLWDTLKPAEVVRLVQETVKHPAMCAKRLVAEAMQNGGCRLEARRAGGSGGGAVE